MAVVAIMATQKVSTNAQTRPVPLWDSGIEAAAQVRAREPLALPGQFITDKQA
jgi:hypothetical protein